MMEYKKTRNARVCQRRLKTDPLNDVIADLKLTHPCR